MCVANPVRNRTAFKTVDSNAGYVVISDRGLLTSSAYFTFVVNEDGSALNRSLLSLYSLLSLLLTCDIRFTLKTNDSLTVRSL